MLAAEVLPNLSRLITTRSSGISIFRAADRIMRAFAWWGITYWTSSGASPFRERSFPTISGSILTANLKTSRPFWKSLSSSPGWPARPSGAPLPSAPRMWSTKPDSPSPASSTTAPAPSPKSTAVDRSAGSTIVLIASAPMSKILPAAPERIIDDATEAAYEYPAHAAARSIAPAPGAPISSPTRQATEGMDSGAVEVPQITRSTDLPSTPACSRALFEASTASVAAFSPSARKWRALIPVRVEIQSSVVSNTLSRSLLVTTLFPRALPTPTILPAAPPFKPTCPQTDLDCAQRAPAAVPRSGRRPCARYRVTRSPRQQLASFRGRSRPSPLRRAGRNHRSSQDPPCLSPHQPRTKDTCGEFAHNIARHRGADHTEDLTRHPLGRLEDDITRKA